MATAVSGISLCVGGLIIGIVGEIVLGILNFIFSILIAIASVFGFIAFMVWLLTI